MLGATADLGSAVYDWFVSDFYVYLSIVFSICYNWWICLLVWLLSSFLFLITFLFFYFNNFYCFILIILFLFILFYFFSFFFSPFFSEPCGWQGLGAPAWCQAWASEMGELSSGHWTTRDLQTPVMSISESCPRDLHLNAKTQLHPTASNIQCWMPQAKQIARQEHNPTH